MVLGDVYAARVDVENLDCLALLARAEDDPQRRLFRGLALVLVEPTQVQPPLRRVGRFEVTELQLDRDQSLHAALEEQQVEVVVVAVQRDPLLTLDERIA